MRYPVHRSRPFTRLASRHQPPPLPLQPPPPQQSQPRAASTAQGILRWSWLRSGLALAGVRCTGAAVGAGPSSAFPPATATATTESQTSIAAFAAFAASSRSSRGVLPPIASVVRWTAARAEPEQKGGDLRLRIDPAEVIPNRRDPTHRGTCAARGVASAQDSQSSPQCVVV